jgi:hypothetical protein
LQKNRKDPPIAERKDMLNKKTVDLYGIISITVMLVLLLLLWLQIVPRTLSLPVLLVALALFLMRITMRLILARQERQARKTEEQP